MYREGRKCSFEEVPLIASFISETDNFAPSLIDRRTLFKIITSVFGIEATTTDNKAVGPAELPTETIKFIDDDNILLLV